LFGLKLLLTSKDNDDDDDDNKDICLIDYLGFMFTVAGCHVKDTIFKRDLTVHVETKPTFGICFQCCATE
jgi:hypothetical protein